MTAADDKLASALAFAELGCRIVPVAGKNPGGYVGTAWQQQATSNPTKIAGWLERWPDANIGIVPGQALLPADVDNPLKWKEFQEQHGQSPLTPAYLTGGDGGRCRLLFKHPGGGALAHARRDLTQGVQLRHGEALMCTVPPGVHAETGRPIEWLEPLTTPLADMPLAWLEVLQQNARGDGGPKYGAGGWGDRLTEIVTPDIGRHPRLMELAAMLMCYLRDAVAVYQLVGAWNETHCLPPKPDSEVLSIVEWAAEQEARKHDR